MGKSLMTWENIHQYWASKAQYKTKLGSLYPSILLFIHLYICTYKCIYLGKMFQDSNLIQLCANRWFWFSFHFSVFLEKKENVLLKSEKETAKKKKKKAFILSQKVIFSVFPYF